MNLFYIPRSASEDDEIILNEEESRHAVSVMRKKAGDGITLTDGLGNWYESVITEPDHYSCKVRIEKKIPFTRRNFRLVLAVAPTKNIDRFEWFLEKATEIGVEGVYPLGCRRNERSKVNQERLNRVIISAFKQSLKAYLPVLYPFTDFRELIIKPFEGQKLIAHSADSGSGEQVPGTAITSVYKRGSDVMILVGPEGDFTPDELSLAKENGFLEINLGPSRLRTETAGVVACNAISLLNL